MPVLVDPLSRNRSFGLRKTITIRLKHEIDRLFDLQHDAVEQSIYLGMTPDETKVVEARRKQIPELVGERSRL